MFLLWAFWLKPSEDFSVGREKTLACPVFFQLACPVSSTAITIRWCKRPREKNIPISILVKVFWQLIDMNVIWSFRPANHQLLLLCLFFFLVIYTVKGSVITWSKQSISNKGMFLPSFWKIVTSVVISL